MICSPMTLRSETFDYLLRGYNVVYTYVESITAVQDFIFLNQYWYKYCCSFNLPFVNPHKTHWFRNISAFLA